jgi:hypothetical protein
MLSARPVVVSVGVATVPTAVRGIAIVADQPTRAGGDGVARGCDQRVYMSAGCAEPSQTTMGLCGIETPDDAADALTKSLERHGSQTI